MSDVLVLLPNPNVNSNGGCVPDQNPWDPGDSKKVRVVNVSGGDQVLTKISGGCLKRNNGNNKKEITLVHGQCWEGKAGKKGIKGTYEYDDGEAFANVATRNGHIDPS